MITIKNMTREQVARVAAFLGTLHDNIEADIKHYGPGDDATAAMRNELAEIETLGGLLAKAEYSEDGIYAIDAIYAEEVDGVHQPYGTTSREKSVEDAILSAMYECAIDNNFVDLTGHETEEELTAKLEANFREYGYPLIITKVTLDGEFINFEQPELPE